MGVETSENQNAENQKDGIYITFNGKNYEVSLPLKDNISECLPSDYDLCHARLESVFCRLQKDPQLCQEYDAIIKEQSKSDIIERFPKAWKLRQMLNIFHIIVLFIEIMTQFWLVLCLMVVLE